MINSFLLGILIAITANVLGLGLKKFLESQNRRKQLQVADEARFRAVLESDSLRELGKYLDSAVGQFRIRDFAENAIVRERVTTFLGRIEEFVGLPEAIEEKREEPVETELLQIPLADSELQRVESRIEEGALWDALAALRRTIERRLLDLARQSQVSVPSQPGAGRLLRLLRERQILPPDVAKSLQFAIEVANRGVHGVAVTSDEAMMALRQAQTALRKLELLRQ